MAVAASSVLIIFGVTDISLLDEWAIAPAGAIARYHTGRFCAVDNKISTLHKNSMRRISGG
jgi:hypothetical protein